MEDFDFHRVIGMVTACAVMPNVFADSPMDFEGNLLTCAHLFIFISNCLEIASQTSM